MLVQLLALYTDPESHNAHVTDRRTDDMTMPIADHTAWLKGQRTETGGNAA